LEYCITPETCVNAGGYWYNDTCNTEVEASPCITLKVKQVKHGLNKYEGVFYKIRESISHPK